MDVIRTLLRLNEEHEDEGEGDIDTEFQRNVPRFELLGDTETVKKLEGVLTDKNKLPSLSACKLGNAEQRNYRLDLPDNSHNEVPRSPIPHNEVNRIAAAKAAGLLRLANLLAPEIPSTDLSEPKPDTHELELLCQLAAKTMDCAYSFVAIMCAKHEHFLAGNQPGIAGAVMPREHTTCQHAIMAPEPFVVTHPEADVRLHKTKATVQFGIRFYVGFPLTLRVTDGRPGGEEMTVGTLCCIDTKPRAEVTRTQYATMKLLASAATHFLLQKCRQI
ncbi:UDP-N-acetylglucosamine diphosphorylase 2 [Phytophthora cinnamomi]|uniref:UDP-N-acetylglucosamine diphosphorylase 2 n=1 Tax=Phytophthora cinnamomi TaxID=4785 RepID=UPI0035594772|nr:UDP-N-acetylglucosamine diphosphorylase 2 [Phytophthora cinnamomi]